MRLRSEGLVLAAWLVGAAAPPTAAWAQQVPVGVDASCACYVPGEPGGEGEPPGESGSDFDRRWLLAGVAGLAVLSGMPFGGGAGAPGLPFGAGGAALPTAPGAELGALGPAPGDDQGPLTERRAASRQPQFGTAPDPGTMTPLSPAEPAQVGMVPPKTATHLPLLAAAGIFLVGSGSVLARRNARRHRRRRRLVSL